MQLYGRNQVEHLSTALTARDRARTLARVRQRLRDPSDCDWTLVATSCVEAGVDFSFSVGFRETASLSSLLQASGRVNRNGKTKTGTAKQEPEWKNKDRNGRIRTEKEKSLKYDYNPFTEGLSKDSLCLLHGLYCTGSGQQLRAAPVSYI